jgi:hypothetical protein
MGQHNDVFRTLQMVRKRGMPWWWLYASTCTACGQTWLVAQEDHNDLFIMLRLSQLATEQLLRDENWPSDFDRYERLLEIGRRAGHSVRYLNAADSPLLHNITELACERPGLRVSELALLLNLDQSIASDLAHQVVHTAGLRIEFDTD